MYTLYIIYYYILYIITVYIISAYRNALAGSTSPKNSKKIHMNGRILVSCLCVFLPLPFYNVHKTTISVMFGVCIYLDFQCSGINASLWSTACITCTLFCWDTPKNWYSLQHKSSPEESGRNSTRFTAVLQYAW